MAGKTQELEGDEKKLELQGKSVKYVRKYIDKAGKRRWKGTKSLRSSELLDIYLRCFFSNKFDLYGGPYCWIRILDVGDTGKTACHTQ